MRYSNFRPIKRIKVPSHVFLDHWIDYASIDVTEVAGYLWWKRERTTPRLIYREWGDTDWHFSDTGNTVPFTMQQYISAHSAMSHFDGAA